MQLRSLRRTFSGTQLKFWIGLILHMLHYKMACIHSLFGVMTTWLHPEIIHRLRFFFRFFLFLKMIYEDVWNAQAYINRAVL